MTGHTSGPSLYGGTDIERGLFVNFPVRGDPDHIVFWDDFDRIVIDITNDWTVVKDSGASVAIEADTVFGRLLMSSTATTDNDGSSIQGNEIFRVATGREIYFETLLQVSDADQMDVYAGLSINFATNPEAVLTAADRIGFQIDDGNASILAKTEFSGTETSTDTGIDAVDATDIKLGFKITNDAIVHFYVNRVEVATHTTNIVTDQELTPALMELSGNATGTKTMSVDYVLCVMSR